MPPLEQALFDAVPVTGEITYDALRTALVTTGKQSALSMFHKMRRSEQIIVRLENTPNGLVSYVKRP
jgi:hypothetical protein